MPTALPDSATTTKDTPVTIDVLANDSGTGITIISVGNPAHGQAVVNPDQTITYTPGSGFVGLDVFSYTIRDAAMATASSDVVITVALPNQPPVAGDIELEAIAGVVTVVPVLAHASDPDGDALRLTGLGTPSFGSLDVHPDQTVAYLPQAGFTGIDSFTYSVGDGRGGSATGTVILQVASANTAPTAKDDIVSTPRDTPLLIDLLANDVDPDGDPLTLQGFTLPAHGRIAVNPSQTVTYTPDPGFYGVDSFTYSVGDGRGGVASATVTVTVVDVNQPPIANPLAVVAASGVPRVVDVLANDLDPDGDPLRLVGFTMPGHGTLAVNPDQTFTYTAQADHVGPDSFTYAVADDRGAAASATVSITVEPFNAPPQAADDLYVTAIDTPITIPVLANDTDPEGLPLVILALGEPAHGEAVLNPDQTVTYTPDQGFEGLDSFPYTVADQVGATDDALIAVNVMAEIGAAWSDGTRFTDGSGWLG